ncbi:MAG: response regulator transcription factor [Clostridiales bacterium]|nr:response regulator transcription factor [Clostridiales bacterium]
MYRSRILLVEDDKDIQHINDIYLTRQGYEVVTAGTVADATEAVKQNHLSLIILDVHLPDGSGISLCEEIREKTTIPIIFLSCYGDERDKIRGLMAGGDDYMTKPYALTELAARIHAQLRRSQRYGSKTLEYPPVKIDREAQRVFVNDEDVIMTPKEFQILQVLMENAGVPMSAKDLYERLWGQSPVEGVKTVHVHISAIRKKLQLDYDSGVAIKTIRNTGYCFETYN